MAGLYSKVKEPAYDVVEFPIRDARTRVWLSEKAGKALLKWMRKSPEGGQFQKKLIEMARTEPDGFRSGWIGDDRPIRHEWEQVYRIGIRGSLFRLVGFFEDETRHFIVIDGYTKSGQELNAAERRRIDEVARVRREKDYRKASQ